MIPTIVVLLLIGVAVGVYFCIRKRRKDKAKKEKGSKKGKKSNEDSKGRRKSGVKDMTRLMTGASSIPDEEKKFPLPYPPLFTPKKEKRQPPPRQVQPATLDQERHQFVGPLQMDAQLKGPVRHGTDQAPKSMSIKDVVFDEKNNKVYDIGSDVEVLEPSDNKSKTIMIDDDDNTLVGSSKIVPSSSKK